MNRWSPFVLVGCLIIGYVAGTETAMRSAAPTEQQSAAESPWPAISLAPDQGEPVHWSADDLRQVHTELSARSELNSVPPLFREHERVNNEYS